MASTWQQYPSALAMGSSVFGMSIVVGIVLALGNAMLGLEGSATGGIATMVAGLGVGQFCAGRVGEWMAKRTRWQTAAWATCWGVILSLGLLGVARMAPGYMEGLQAIGWFGLSVILLIAAVIAIPLTYFGLWLGERGAIKQLERRAGKGRS